MTDEMEFDPAKYAASQMKPESEVAGDIIRVLLKRSGAESAPVPPTVN
jgi:negative regulator of replication initiation